METHLREKSEWVPDRRHRAPTSICAPASNPEDPNNPKVGIVTYVRPQSRYNSGTWIPRVTARVRIDRYPPVSVDSLCLASVLIVEVAAHVLGQVAANVLAQVAAHVPVDLDKTSPDIGPQPSILQLLSIRF